MWDEIVHESIARLIAIAGRLEVLRHRQVEGYDVSRELWEAKSDLSCERVRLIHQLQRHGGDVMYRQRVAEDVEELGRIRMQDQIAGVF